MTNGDTPAPNVPSVEDVMMLLGLEDVSTYQEIRIERAIESAKSWAKRYLRYDYENLTETGTETFYDVNEDGAIPTPVEGATILSVTVFRAPGSSGEELSNTSYAWNDRQILLWPIQVYSPFEGATATRIFGTYRKVVVEYDSSDVGIPPGIRDGVALAAAAIWLRSPKLAGGLSSESIGDYSYSLAKAAGEHPMFGEAKALLHSFRRQTQMV